MSKDPNTNAPPKAAPQASLEDLVYRSSLAEGNAAVHRANPLVTIPVTLACYGLFGGAGYFVATQTKMGKEVVKKTIGIDLNEQKEEDAPPPPPPPPPPAPAAPMAPRVETKVDAPPPPPINPQQDVVPEVAPRELPKQDLSLAYAGQGSSGGTGGPSTAGFGNTAAAGIAIAGATTTKVVDFDFSQIKVKYQPPPPPYPPLAKIAKIQGTVVVEIIVGTDGIPTKATALEGPPQLRATAEQYALAWKFEPAMMNGAPQTARFKLTMPFRLK